jgi:molybdopterin/thiamine biosynthesis adenylyltransferase
MSRADSKVLFIGVGGLGCPASRVLAESGVGTLLLVDDDVVSLSNLHRQILFDAADVGQPKAPLAAAKLRALGAQVEVHETRFVPENARELLQGVDLVVEGADNLATKFLAADAAQLCKIPIVHAGAVRWGGWALASDYKPQHHSPCLRCLFEDVPTSQVDNCEFAGVVGPVVGALGALEALLALRMLDGEDAGGTLFRLDGLRPSLRQTRFRTRPGCPHSRGEIKTLVRSRYAAP